MRSLVVTRFSPFPPTAGVPLRVAANLAALARLGPVDVVIIGDRPIGPVPSHVDRVETFDIPAQGRVAAMARRFGLRHRLASELHLSSVEGAIERLGVGPGLIVLEEVWMAPYVDVARRTGRDLVYDSHNVETVLRRQIASIGPSGPLRHLRRAMIGAQVRRLEQTLVECADQTWVCSANDRRALGALFTATADVRVVPNAADTERLRAEVEAASDPPTAVGPDDQAIIFLGDLRYAPNEDGALLLLNDVMPLVERQLPDARAVFVGRRPTDRLIAAARAHNGATVTGEVDSVVPYLAHGKVLAVTLRIGGGTRLKIVEAMAAGLPIVTTTKGLEGIDAAHEEHVLIADEPEQIADAIVRVLADPDAAAGMAERARRLVELSYSWASVARLVDDATAGLACRSAMPA